MAWCICTPCAPDVQMRRMCDFSHWMIGQSMYVIQASKPLWADQAGRHLASGVYDGDDALSN